MRSLRVMMASLLFSFGALAPALGFKFLEEVQIETSYYSAVVDTERDVLWAGTEANPPQLLRIRLADLSLEQSVDLPSDQARVEAVALDSQGYAYFGARTADPAVSPGKIFKVRLEDFSIESVLTLEAGERAARVIVIDGPSGTAYVGVTAGLHDKIVKIDLSDLSRTAAITLDQVNGISMGFLDVANGYAIFASENKGVLVRIRLTDFTRVSNGLITQISGGLLSGVLDSSQGYLYVAANNQGGASGDRITRVRLSPFGIDGSIVLFDDERHLGAAVIDSANNAAYFAGPTSHFYARRRVVKVGLDQFERMGSITIEAGSGPLAVLDSSRQLAYVGRATLRVAKVDMSPDTTPPSIEIPAYGGIPWRDRWPLTAVAEDNSAIDRVEYFVNGAVVGMGRTRPDYSYLWYTPSVASGVHAFRADAVDSSGNRTPSETITIVVDNDSPTVSVTEPTPNAVLSGVIDVVAEASPWKGMLGSKECVTSVVQF